MERIREQLADVLGEGAWATCTAMRRTSSGAKRAANRLDTPALSGQLQSGTVIPQRRVSATIPRSHLYAEGRLRFPILTLPDSDGISPDDVQRFIVGESGCFVLKATTKRRTGSNGVYQR